MGFQHQRFAAFLILTVACGLSQADSTQDARMKDPAFLSFYEPLLEFGGRAKTVPEQFQVIKIQQPTAQRDTVRGPNGQLQNISRTQTPNLIMDTVTIPMRTTQTSTVRELRSLVDKSAGKAITDDVKAQLLELAKAGEVEEPADFSKFLTAGGIPELFDKAPSTSAPAAHESTAATTATADLLAKFNEAAELVATQFEGKDREARERIQSMNAQTLASFNQQQAAAQNQQQREEAARRQAEERERQRQADEAAKAEAAAGGPGGGGGANGGSKNKGVQAVKIEAPQGNPPQLQVPTVPQGEFNANLFNRPASRGIASVDSNAINPVSLSNLPVVPKMPGKSFADNNGESLKFNSGLPPVKGGSAGSAIQNAGSIPPSNASLGDNGSAPAPGLAGGATPGGNATSGDPYASNGIQKAAKAPSYSLVKDGKYGEANSSGDDGESGDGEDSVDGGGDGASAVSTKNLFKEVLVPVAVAKNGPRGVFGYMGLIRTICASPKGKQVGVCSSSRTASLPRSGSTNVTVALALTGK